MEISLSSVRELPQYLVELPRFAYQCSLAGIFNNHQWTPNQSTTFIQLAKKPNTTWDMVMSNVEAGVLQVDLKELVVFGVESNITSIATFLELTKWFFLSIFFIFFSSNSVGQAQNYGEIKLYYLSISFVSVF